MGILKSFNENTIEIQTINDFSRKNSYGILSLKIIKILAKLLVALNLLVE
jgi:hypothetical protein